MRNPQKRNVSEFNADVASNSGYRYTTNAPYSAIVANARITKAILDTVPRGLKTLIDIGCGDGSYTAQYKERLPQIAITGFDPATAAIQLASERYPDVEFLVGDLLNPGTFPKRRFDMALIRGVIHHLPDAFAGITNATKLSDRLVLIEPNGNNPILKWIEKHSEYHIAHEEQSFSSQQIVDWCRKANFHINKVDYIGFVPYFFPTALAKLIHFMQPALEMIHPLKKYFGAQIVIICEKHGDAGK